MTRVKDYAKENAP